MMATTAAPDVACVSWIPENYFDPENYTHSSSGTMAAQPGLSRTGAWLTHPILVDPKVKEIKKDLEYEKIRYASYLADIDSSKILEIDSLINKIARINYLKSAVEITPSSTVKFTFSLANDILLIVDKPLNGELTNKNDVIFSLFVNGDLLISDVDDIRELSSKANKISQSY